MVIVFPDIPPPEATLPPEAVTLPDLEKRPEAHSPRRMTARPTAAQPKIIRVLMPADLSPGTD
jgi:hypothetical protein